MITFKRTTKAQIGIQKLLLVAGALSLTLPVLASRHGESTPSGEGQGNRSGMLAPDDELVGTLPIFFDPDSGMPIPEQPEDPDGEPDDEPDDPAPPGGGGGLLGPDLPPVLGAPRLFLYGPYHLLALHRSAFDAQQLGVFHSDATNPTNAYLVLPGSCSFEVSEDFFTIHGIETGLLIGANEVAPVMGCVSYLGQLSRPIQMPGATKKDFPIGALAEYGFLLDGVGLLTRSSLFGRSIMSVKGDGDIVHVTYWQF